MSRFQTRRAVMMSLLIILTACTDEEEKQMSIDFPLASPLTVGADDPGLLPRGVTCPDIKPPDGVIAPSIVEAADRVERETGFKNIEPNNEVHDCQRFVITHPNGSQTYSPVMTLWIDRVAGRPYYSDPTSIGAIHSDTTQPFRHGRLRFAPGWNCIVVKGQKNKLRDWEGWIIPIHATKGCADPTVSGASRLNVSRSLQFATPPSAGRWIEYRGTYFAGIQCGPEQFCMIGVPQQGEAPPGMETKKNARGDYQRLSVMRGGGLQASDLYGTLEADSVDNRDLLSTYANRWVQVAHLTINGDDDDARGKYAVKFKLSVTENPALVAEGDTVKLFVLYDPLIQDTTKAWSARFVTPTARGDSTSVYWSRAKHAGTGTTRWRWSDDDETTWVQCGPGCCGT